LLIQINKHLSTTRTLNLKYSSLKLLSTSRV